MTVKGSLATVLKEDILRVIKEGGDRVEDVVSILQPGYTEDMILRTIDSLEQKKQIELLETIPKEYGLGRYMVDPNYSLWFHLVISTVFFMNGLVFGLSATLPFSLIRIALAFVFVLYLPGFVFVEMMFPKRSELRRYERISLSVGLSFAIVILIGLLLNFAPWGITQVTVVTSTSIFVMIVAFIAVVRKFKKAIRRPSMERAR